ncbi:MAG: hypothetical protein M1833_000195 [Piccolia ochrophora]|nr:MAG: hypothetical protein M1833_000195 [Piccolia ochrophora]
MSSPLPQTQSRESHKDGSGHAAPVATSKSSSPPTTSQQAELGAAQTSPHLFQHAYQNPSSATGSLPVRRRSDGRTRTPKLLFEARDACCQGSSLFLRTVHAGTALRDAVECVLGCLYGDDRSEPPTRSVTLILRSMPGVAYTTGKDIDDDHKEIHLSTDYIENISEARQADEILGVLVHEMVHCWQWNAHGTAPGGLIEGIADWVRLRAGFAPPHWKRQADGDWDAGYQHTGYFLDYLEKRFGKDTVRRINSHLRRRRYVEEVFWRQLLGEDVGQLWKEYGEWLKHDKDQKSEGEQGQSCTENQRQENCQDRFDQTSGDEEEPVMIEREEAQLSTD